MVKGSMLQLLVNVIMHQNLPASCCNFTGSDVLIRISAKFDLDLCVTFKSNDLVNAITPQKLHAHVPCCSFTGIFPHQNFGQVLC